MLLCDYSLMENVSSKLLEKAESISDLRKSIVNYTNNFREFKNMKANLINSLFDYEDCFFQLSHIIKTVTDQNANYLQTFKNLKTKHFEFENKITELEYENIRLRNLSQSIQNNFTDLSEFNKDKDSFMKDLINKVNYLENVLKEYQKKYYIPKYSKIFEFNTQLVDGNKIKKLYNNMKIMEHLKIEEIEKNGFDLKQELKGFRIDKDREASGFGSNDNEVKEKNQKKLDEEDYKSNSKKIAERPKTPGNFRTKQPQNQSQSSKQINIEKEDKAPIYPEDLKNKDHSNFIKIANTATAYEILLKVFSNQQLNYHLKRKFGDDYQLKLTDLNIDEAFLSEINSEIFSFNEKENFKSTNFNMHEINNCLKSLSPKNFDFAGEYQTKKKQFNPYTRKSPEFFDSSIQYGGESHVLKALKDFNRTFSNKNSKSPIRKNSANNFNSSSSNNFGSLKSLDENNINDINHNKDNNDNEFGYAQEKNEYNNMNIKRGFSSHSGKLNSDFFINNEITHELLKKPVKIGVENYSGKFNSKDKIFKNNNF